MTLIGAEEVSRAANRMVSAAQQMSAAAGSMDLAFHRFIILLTEENTRHEAVMRELNDG